MVMHCIFYRPARFHFQIWGNKIIIFSNQIIFLNRIVIVTQCYDTPNVHFHLTTLIKCHICDDATLGEKQQQNT